MKNIKQLSYTLLIIIFAASCRKDDKLGDISNIPGLGGDTWTKGPIDSFIYENLTKPFNIAISYKWNQFTVAQLSKNVVPPKEDVVIPALQSALINVWAKPYIAEKDSLFLKQFAPKTFVLAGSAAYNNDGTATLGVAGGGRQITLFQLNYFRPRSQAGHVASDTIIQKEVYHTIHHEFAHIFDQVRRRPEDFNVISQSDYSADWINVSDAESREKGFVSAYASSQPGEDWAEMFAFMLVEGDAGFAQLVNSITSAEGKDHIWQKRQVIITYLQQTWNINFLSLQARVRAAIDAEF